MKKFTLCCLLSALLMSVHTAKAELIPYEPGGNTLPPGTVESGQIVVQTRVFNYEDEFGGDGSYGINIGDTEIRYGLTDRIEARIMSSGVVVTDGAVGFDDLGLGFKVGLIKEQKGIIPAVSIFGDFGIPIGRKELRSPGFSHAYTLSTLNNITDHTTILTNIGVGFADDGAGGTAVDIPYSLALGYAINDLWGVFTDVYGSWGDSGNPISIDTGLTYNLNDNVALDCSISMGLNESAPDFAIGGGVSFGLGHIGGW